MSRQRRILTRLLPAAGLLLLAVVGVIAALGAGSGHSAPDAPAPRPILGAVDGETVLFGAATSGDAAGQSWGYRLLPLDVPAPEADGRRLAFGPVVGGSATPQLAFVRGTADGTWQIAQTPVDEHGDPYRGPLPNGRSARLTPNGGGVLVGQDSNRPTDAQTVLLRRQPGGTFAAIPGPPATVLLGEDDPTPATPPRRWPATTAPARSTWPPTTVGPRPRCSSPPSAVTCRTRSSLRTAATATARGPASRST